jgi:hypothetical protein
LLFDDSLCGGEISFVLSCLVGREEWLRRICCWLSSEAAAAEKKTLARAYDTEKYCGTLKIRCSSAILYDKKGDREEDAGDGNETICN